MGHSSAPAVGLAVPGIWDLGVGGQSSFFLFLVMAVITDGTWQFDELYPEILRCYWVPIYSPPPHHENVYRIWAGRATNGSIWFYITV
ncbi:hypothetical protein VTN00DRAFT_564 [Thermoascus crustaceus]|uniref:uncharacterized protein n=1 Tax=Thermoascus crustaceus TaxID=5088 RepID=UPI0037428D21